MRNILHIDLVALGMSFSQMKNGQVSQIKRQKLLVVKEHHEYARLATLTGYMLSLQFTYTTYLYGIFVQKLVQVIYFY